VRNGKNWAETGYFSKNQFLACFCQFGPHFAHIYIYMYMYIYMLGFKAATLLQGPIMASIHS
jgi:hypothetical protein